MRIEQSEDVMKNILRAAVTASVVMLSASWAARAADLPPNPAPMPRAPAAYIPVEPPMYNWGGIYLGINGGWGWGAAKLSAAGLNANSNDNGGVVGLTG